MDWTEERDAALAARLDNLEKLAAIPPECADIIESVQCTAVFDAADIRALRNALLDARRRNSILERLMGVGCTTRGLAQLEGRERDAVLALRDLCETQGLTLSARVRFHPMEPMVRNLDAGAEDDGTLHVWLDGPFRTELGLGEEARKRARRGGR